MKLDQGSLGQGGGEENGVFVAKRPARVEHCSGSDGVSVKATLRGRRSSALGRQDTYWHEEGKARQGVRNSGREPSYQHPEDLADTRH